MTIYIVLYSFLTTLLLIVWFLENAVARRVIFWFSFFVLWIFASARYQVGTDYDAYWQFIKLNRGNFEPVYTLIRNAILFLNLSPLIFFSLCSFLTLFFFYKAVVKFDIQYAEIIIILFFLTGLYTNSFNVVRQFVSLSIYLYFALPYLVNKNFFKYCIAVTAAAMFHYSALFMLPAYFFLQKDFGIRAGIILIGLALIFNLGFFNVAFVNNFLGILPSKYAGYLQYLQHYLSSLYEPVYLKLLNNIDKIIISFLLLYHRKKLTALSKYNQVFINFYLFFATFTVASRGLGELQRFGYYFYILSPFAIVLLIKIWDGRYKKLAITFSLIMIYFIYNVFIILMKNFGGIVPYKSFL